jgi:hypothetical protein
MAESVARTEKLNDPAVVGVPDSTPAEERDIPGGGGAAGATHAYGGFPPETVSVAGPYAASTVPLGSGELVLIRSGFGFVGKMGATTLKCTVLAVSFPPARSTVVSSSAKSVPPLGATTTRAESAL